MRQMASLLFNSASVFKSNSVTKASQSNRQLLATSMELRLDQFAYMITAAHLVYSKVDLHPDSYSRARIESGEERSRNRKQIRQLPQCLSFIHREIFMTWKSFQHTGNSYKGDFVPKCQTPGGLLSRGLLSVRALVRGVCSEGAYVRFPDVRVYPDTMPPSLPV